MPGKLEELIKKINKEDDSKVTCVLADICMSWFMHVAEKWEFDEQPFGLPQ